MLNQNNVNRDRSNDWSTSLSTAIRYCTTRKRCPSSSRSISTASACAASRSRTATGSSCTMRMPASACARIRRSDIRATRWVSLVFNSISTLLKFYFRQAVAHDLGLELVQVSMSRPQPNVHVRLLFRREAVQVCQGR